MSLLTVPYRRQENEFSCGAAAFEMVFRYYRPFSSFNAKRFFQRLQHADPHYRGAVQISTHNLVQGAVNRGFDAHFGVLRPTLSEMVEDIDAFASAGIPLIACQRLSDELPASGHFRVVLGTDGAEIVVHDPLLGPNQRWSAEKFFEYLRPTGASVAGGICVCISRQPPAIRLSSDQSGWRALSIRLTKDGRLPDESAEDQPSLDVPASPPTIRP